jgi:hypothetical protein
LLNITEFIQKPDPPKMYFGRSRDAHLLSATFCLRQFLFTTQKMSWMALCARIGEKLLSLLASRQATSQLANVTTWIKNMQEL